MSNDQSSDNWEDLLNLTAEIEELYRKNQGLIQQLEFAEEAAKVAQKAQLIGEERLRRQNELLEEAQKAANTAIKEQSQVMAKLTELQKCTDSIDDGEAVQVMRGLFQKLEDWIKRFCSQLSPPRYYTSNHDSDEEIPSKGSRGVIQALQAVISEHIFHGILSRVMVGLPDRYWDNVFLEFDREIQSSVPPHVWQHWRSSTSLAAASLTSGGPNAICDQIMQTMNSSLAIFPPTIQKDGLQQFKDLLLECMEFKLRLERQGYVYCFHWSGPGTPFHQDQMRSLTGLSANNVVVLQSIWPMLCKGTSNNWTVVEKEFVQLIEEPTPKPTTVTDLQS